MHTFVYILGPYNDETSFSVFQEPLTIGGVQLLLCVPYNKMKFQKLLYQENYISN